MYLKENRNVNIILSFGIVTNIYANQVR